MKYFDKRIKKILISHKKNKNPDIIKNIRIMFFKKVFNFRNEHYI
jgi:hypothetical protein